MEEEIKKIEFVSKSYTMDAETLELLDQIAGESGLSASEIVRSGVRQLYKVRAQFYMFLAEQDGVS